MVCVAWVQERTKNGQEGTFWGDGGVLWFGAIVIRVYELSKLIEPKTCALLFILLITLLLLNSYYLIILQQNIYVSVYFQSPVLSVLKFFPVFKRENWAERGLLTCSVIHSSWQKLGGLA